MGYNKSRAKAYGVKSTILYDNKVIMTSFGEGNLSEQEKKIENEEIKNVHDPAVYEAALKENKIEVSKNSNDPVLINNPLYNKNVDYLNAKSSIEKSIFGKTFKDNLHIQIAYNILDINKILSLYFFNIVYIIENLQRKKRDNDSDLVGTFCYRYNYKKSKENSEAGKITNSHKDSYLNFNEFQKNASPYFCYFGNTFNTNSKQNASVDSNESVYNYNVLRLLSLMRQSLIHNERKKGNKNVNHLFKLDKLLKEYSDLQDTLDDIYQKDARKFKENVLKNSTKNIEIISELLNIEENKKELLFTQYYNFTVYKESKNIGINIKKIRETIYAQQASSFDVMNHDYDSFRPKINKVVDFLIYYTICIENKTLQEKMVEELRESLNDNKKDEIYENYAKSIGEKIEALSKIVEIVKKVTLDNKVKKIIFDDNDLKSTSNVSIFSKYIYFISKFLDGKEINELFSSLINKFENIDQLSRLLSDIEDSLYCGKLNVTEDYELFNNDIRNIANELRFCKCLAQIKPEINKKDDDIKINLARYTDAVKVLNKDMNKVEAECEKMLQDEHGKKRTKGDNKLRNFIVNNVIKSRRFIYIVKYNNPVNCHRYIENEVILKFVFNEIPDSQIDRYYTNITGLTSNNKTIKIDKLISELKEFDFSTLSKNEYKMRNNYTATKMKTLVGLYLTIIYLITKSLVKINSIYIMAFNSYNRDFYYFYPEDDPYNNPCKLYEMMNNKDVDRYKNSKNNIKKHLIKNWQEYNNLFKCDDYENSKKYRDKVVHLNAIENAHNYLDIGKMTSYYDLYQYILQRYLFGNSKKKEIQHYLRYIAANHTYSKNLTKVMNMPFAYNLSRYKNLAMADVFNKKYLLLEKDEKETKEER